VFPNVITQSSCEEKLSFYRMEKKATIYIDLVARYERMAEPGRTGDLEILEAMEKIKDEFKLKEKEKCNPKV
jgi:hypothetical protein